MNHIKDSSTIIDKDNIECVVEIPKGSRIKYEIEATKGDSIYSVRELNKRFKYPYNYGFIPNTLEEDHDPMDVCILCSDRMEPLTHVICKVIGCYRTVDNGEQDDKIFVIPNYIKMPRRRISKEIAKAYRFLKKYKYPYHKNTLVDKTFYSAEDAYNLIEMAVKRENPTNVSSKVTLS